VQLGRGIAQHLRLQTVIPSLESSRHGTPATLISETEQLDERNRLVIIDENTSESGLERDNALKGFLMDATRKHEYIAGQCWLLWR
jgi:hypothetical protein